ncbi:recombinase family protein [Bradyrhizobium genosp. P]|uniref:recombinase family protein n=1 Tax=Bradyrhizobium genosp. P TaxID=83641 RepID=UPI003CF1FDA6
MAVGNCRELNRRGVLTNRGGPSRQKAINAILHNEAHIGNFIYNRDTEKLGAKRAHNPRDLWVRSEGTIEPIVERDVFLRARRAMEQRRVCVTLRNLYQPRLLGQTCCAQAVGQAASRKCGLSLQRF